MLLGKLPASLRLRFLIREPLNECMLLGLEGRGLSGGRMAVRVPECVVGVRTQLVKVPWTVQLQNCSQQLFLGAYCHLGAFMDTAGWGNFVSGGQDSAAQSTLIWGTEGQSACG